MLRSIKDIGNPEKESEGGTQGFTRTDMKMFFMDQQDLMERKIVHLQSSLQSLIDQNKLVQAELKNLVQNSEQKKEPVNTEEDGIDETDDFQTTPAKRNWAKLRLDVIDGKLNKRRLSMQ